MPTYEYACSECGTQHDIVQKMTDPTLTTCPACGKEGLRKQFSGVGVVFKGSGFYRTDSRGKSGDSAAGSSGASAGSAGSSGSSSSTSSGSSSSGTSSSGSSSSGSSSTPAASTSSSSSAS